jgi:hypothetical protein
MPTSQNPLAAKISILDRVFVFWHRGAMTALILFLLGLGMVALSWYAATGALGHAISEKFRNHETEAMSGFFFGIFLVLLSIWKSLIALFASGEAGLRRIVLEQLAQVQRRTVDEYVLMSQLPLSSICARPIVDKQIVILEHYGFATVVRSREQLAASLTPVGWSRLERKERKMKLPEFYTMNDMSNNFNNSPVGNFSSVTNSQNVSVQQNQSNDVVQSQILAEQLGRLRPALMKENLSIEKTIGLGKIAEAEQLAQKGDHAGAVRIIKSVGKWVLEVAEKLSVDVVVELIKHPG